MKFEDRFDRWVQHEVDEVVSSWKTALLPVAFGILIVFIVGMVVR